MLHELLRSMIVFLLILKKVIVNIQDLYPQTVIDLGLLTNKFLIRVSKWMESFIYRKSDYITVHSEGNLGHVLANGAKKGMASVVHNWVDVEKIQPGSKINRFVFVASKLPRFFALDACRRHGC